MSFCKKKTFQYLVYSSFPAEPQLMLTAGPGMMAPGYAAQNVYGTPAQVYAPAAAAYQGYGM